MLHWEGLPYIPKVISTKLISRHYDNPLAGHFDIKKIPELIAQKYYWLTFHHNIEVYIIDHDVCLALKAVRHKPYGNLQLLLVYMHWYKNFYHRITNFHQLEKWHLQLNPSHRWLAHKDGTLWASQGYYWCSWPRRGHHGYDSMTQWLAWLNRKWLGLGFHLEILVITILLPWDQTKALHYFLPSNWWPDQETKQYNSGLSPSLHQFRVKWLGQALIDSQNCL